MEAAPLRFAVERDAIAASRARGGRRRVKPLLQRGGEMRGIDAAQHPMKGGLVGGLAGAKAEQVLEGGGLGTEPLGDSEQREVITE